MENKLLFPADASSRLSCRFRRGKGLTLIECILAIMILTVVVLGMSYVTTAGHHHLAYSDQSLRAVRLAEHLMEEIISRPYAGSGLTRDTYCLDDYNGFDEPAGELKDATGAAYGEQDQRFSRSVVVTSASQITADSGDLIVTGKFVTVTVQSDEGSTWTLSRFLPEPVLP